jgi:hypothetical protein
LDMEQNLALRKPNVNRKRTEPKTKIKNQR